MVFRTIRPYLKWRHTTQIPFEFNLPKEFEDRISKLSEYLETDQWPCDVGDNLKEQVRTVQKEYLSGVETDLAHAIRIIINIGALDDRSNLTFRAKQVLEIFIRSKITALKRALASFWLNNEPDVLWRQTLRQWDTVWSPKLIYGLTPVIAMQHKWSFWTDADWWFNDEKIRIFVPQLTGRGEEEVREYDEDTYYESIVPQLLDYRITSSDDHFYIPLGPEYKNLLDCITVRGELFIQTESYNFPDGNPGMKAWTLRVAVETITDYFNKLPEENRPEFARKVLHHHHRILEGIRSKVLQAIPEMRSYIGK
jgi:hypothetical protein